MRLFKKVAAVPWGAGVWGPQTRTVGGNNSSGVGGRGKGVAIGETRDCKREAHRQRKVGPKGQLLQAKRGTACSWEVITGGVALKGPLILKTVGERNRWGNCDEGKNEHKRQEDNQRTQKREDCR